MGLLKKLLGVGVTAGATVAAVRVADKYKENNPDGVQDVNGDGKVDARDVLSEVAKAATEVYHDATGAVSQKAPEFTQKAKDAAGAAKEKAEEYAEKAKDAVSDAFSAKPEA